MPQLRRHFGLRTRVALGVLVLSVALWFLLGAIAHVLLRQTQLDRLEARTTASMLHNVEVLRSRLDSSLASPGKVFDGLSRDNGTALLSYEGSYYSSRDEVNFSDLPLSLRQAVEEDKAPSAQRYWRRGIPYFAVGVPIETAPGSYYEAISLEDVQRNLETFLAVRLAAAILTVLAGLLAGRWLARRAVAPLVDIRRAAEAIADNQLDTRLPRTSDPDLNAIVGSFNEMAGALQDRIERDARFASDVSHELRSPLMTLAASVEVLQRRRDELPERAASAVDLLVADIGRFQNLVNDLLEISRFDSGAQHLDRSPLAISAFLEGATRELSRDRKAVRFIPQAGLDDVVILVDRRRLLQVLSNLATNADKHSSGLTVITLDAVPEGIEIGAEDAGAGVPLNERHLIFDRFARGAAAGNRGSDTGTGLGLSLVAEHVRLHGGRVWVEDARHSPTGARFVVFLPCDPFGDSADDDEEDLAHAGAV